MRGSDTFNEIKTFRLAYHECCRLADPHAAEATLNSSEQVDGLDGYTTEMWDILNSVVLQEWFGLRLPRSKTPWGGAVYLPPHLRLIYCLDRTYARQARFDIHAHYLPLKREPPDMSIFAGFGLAISNDFERERDGLEFIARQAEHFRSLDDYLFIVQDLDDVAGPDNRNQIG